MDIRKALPIAYDGLPDGGKKRACEIYGTRVSHFRKIVDGNYKDDSLMYLAMNAVKQAASEIKKDTDKKVKKVLSIKVHQPETVNPN